MRNYRHFEKEFIVKKITTLPLINQQENLRISIITKHEDQT